MRLFSGRFVSPLRRSTAWLATCQGRKGRGRVQTVWLVIWKIEESKLNNQGYATEGKVTWGGGAGPTLQLSIARHLCVFPYLVYCFRSAQVCIIAYYIITTGTIQLLFSYLSEVWPSNNPVLSATSLQNASLWWMSPHSWSKFMGHCRSPGALCSVENQRTSISGTANPPAFISVKCILNQCQAGCKIFVANFIVTPAVPQFCEYLSNYIC